jgi:hypothetical protein
VNGLNLLRRTATFPVDIVIKLALKVTCGRFLWKAPTKVIGYEDMEIIQEFQEELQRWAENPILNLGVEYNSEKFHFT